MVELPLLQKRDRLPHLFAQHQMRGIGCEVGVRHGDFAAQILREWHGSLVLVDAWRHLPNYKDIGNVPQKVQNAIYKQVCQRFDAEKRVHIIRGLSVESAATFPDDLFDWVYIDANHSYKACTRDLHAWWPKLRSGGIFSGHDCLDGNYPEGDFGVKRALVEFSKFVNFQWRITLSERWPSWYGKKEPRIAVLTLYTPEIEELGVLTAANKQEYAAARGYDCIVATQSLDLSRPPAWSKLRLIQEHLAKYDWVFWTDADSLIMDFSLEVRDLLQAADLVITKDSKGINTGMFIARNCWEISKLLADAYNDTSAIHHPWWEQRAIRNVIASDRCFARIKTLPQSAINSYPQTYMEGDAAIHFPGKRNDKLQLIRTFLPRVRKAVMKDTSTIGSAALNIPDLVDVELKQRPQNRGRH